MVAHCDTTAGNLVGIGTNKVVDPSARAMPFQFNLTLPNQLFTHSISLSDDALSDNTKFYSGVDLGLSLKARFFPHITSFKPTVGNETRFEYNDYMDPHNKTSKAVFLAHTKDNQQIAVKFTEVYNKEAHELLANKEFASRLLHYDGETFQDFTMVIMEYADEKQLIQKYSDSIPAEILTKINKALDILHCQDLVFGDLRLLNILVTEDGEIRLMDFNWCEKKGQATYPQDINLLDARGRCFRRVSTCTGQTQ